MSKMSIRNWSRGGKGYSVKNPGGTKTIYLGDAGDAFRERHEKSDRESAVIVGAHIEERLKHLMNCNMMHLSKDKKEAMFGPNGELSLFDTCIKEARKMGIIGPNTQHDLELIKELRNAAAHTTREFSFEIPVLEKAIRTLNCAQDIRFERHNPPGLIAKNMEVRELFDMTAGLLSSYLILRILSPPKKCGMKEIYYWNMHLD